MADTRNRIGGWRIESRQFGVALVLALCGFLLACDTSRQNDLLTDILDDAIALDCDGGPRLASPLPRHEARAFGAACRKEAMERRFKVKILRQTYFNRTRDGVREYLVAQRFTCDEKRIDDKKSLACAFLHEPTMPGLVFGTYSRGFYNWSVEADEAGDGAVSLNVEVVKLKRE